MEKFAYRTTMVCAREIDVTINDDGTIGDVVFLGGCPGSHLGIAALVKGRRPDEVIERLSGVRCGDRPTSCPDQLACALAEYIKAKK